eukprot:tig00021127_g18803.t1
MSTSQKKLAGKVALVTGASRGIGKGIAIGLAEQGAKVYITGRTAKTSGSARVPGSLEETAEMVQKAGGIAVPVSCDHGDDAQVKALFERIYAENPRLDVLVNNVFKYDEKDYTGSKFWDLGVKTFDDVSRIGLRAHFLAACIAAPKMVQEGAGLIVNISSFGGLNRYLFNVPYGLGKAAVDRMSLDMAKELRPHGVACMSMWPGIVRTERMVAMINGMPADRKPFDLADSESPLFTGRVIAALAADPNVMNKSGTIQVVAEAAREYGVRDDDGKQPASLRSLQFLVPAAVSRAIPQWLIPDIRVPFWVMNLRLKD